MASAKRDDFHKKECTGIATLKLTADVKWNIFTCAAKITSFKFYDKP